MIGSSGKNNLSGGLATPQTSRHFEFKLPKLFSDGMFTEQTKEG